MSKSSTSPRRKARSDARSSAGMFAVDGRLFSTRAEALAFCRARQRPAYRISLVPPLGLDVDPLKLSLRPNWSVRAFFPGSAEPVLVFEHEGEPPHAFSVRMVDLVDLVSSVKSRVRELSRAGALL